MIDEIWKFLMVISFSDTDCTNVGILTDIKDLFWEGLKNC